MTKIRSIATWIVISTFSISCADFTNSKRSNTEKNPITGSNPGGGSLPVELQKPNEGPFSEAKMLVNIGMNIQYKAALDLNDQVKNLQTKVNRYCESLEKDLGVEKSLFLAQEQFKEAMLSYHFSDAISAGPLSLRSRWLADNIYSWPYIDYCGIDKQVLQLSQSPNSKTRSIHTSKGLGAIEYLLFETTLNPRCNLRANPDLRAWMNKPELIKKQDRCAEAQVLMTDLQEMTSQLKNDWEPERGNFALKMVDGSVYSSLNASTNAVVDSLFLGIEKLKDVRLGKPLGRHKECLNENKKCPEMAEHALSGIALKAAEAQLKGYAAAWTGDLNEVQGFGLEDFVRYQGQPQAAEQMNAFLKDAFTATAILQDDRSLQDKINDMDSSLCAATTKSDRKVELCALHADVREIANLLKIEIFSILSLRVPSFGQGDND